MSVSSFSLMMLGVLVGMQLVERDASAQSYYHPSTPYYQPHYQTPSPSYYPPANGGIIGGLVGGLLHTGMVSQAQAAWSSFDPYIVQCINGSGRVTVPILINRGILPNDPRVANLIRSCQALIAQRAAQAQQQAALAQQQAQHAQEQAESQARQEEESKAEQAERRAAATRRAAQAQAAEQAAQQNERTEAAARAAHDAADQAEAESLAAQSQRRAALFIQFQTKTVNPSDRLAALLNYTTFGLNSGTPTSFWAKKDGSNSVYVEFQEGTELAEPVVTVREIDTSRINPANFYVKASDNGVTTSMHGAIFAECSSCDRADIQSRWLDFFSNHQK